MGVRACVQEGNGGMRGGVGLDLRGDKHPQPSGQWVLLRVERSHVCMQWVGGSGKCG